MSRMSRNKGKRGELEAAKEIARLFDLPFGADGMHRGQQFCGLDGSADIVGFPGIHFEIKRVERFCLHPSLEQSDSDKKCGDIPVVLTRQNGKGWVFACYLDDLPKAIERLNNKKEEDNGG